MSAGPEVYLDSGLFHARRTVLRAFVVKGVFMSHYAVIVIGENVDEQLAPYDENIEVDPYWEDECSTPIKFWGFGAYQEEWKLTPESSMQDLLDAIRTAWPNEADEYRINGDGVLQHERTYNPNSKWDWYEPGGRWSDWFLDNDGVRRDTVLSQHVDWTGMKLEAMDEANKWWEGKIAPIIADGIKPPEPFSTIRERHANISDARDEYNSQPFIFRLNQAGVHLVDDPVEALCLDAEDPKLEYLSRAADSAISPLAIVINGEWFTKGEMGWWGIVYDEITQKEWNARARELLTNQEPGVLLTMVDCHI